MGKMEQRFNPGFHRADFLGDVRRGGGATNKSWEELFIKWMKDKGRTINYLETRQDIDIQTPPSSWSE